MDTKLQQDGDMSVVFGFNERLKKAVNHAGGATAVSRSSGVALSTLNDYLKGKEARFSRMAALAKACDVSLDWIATGRGDMTPGQQSDGMTSYFGEYLYKPANFMSLCLLLSLCQEYHHRGGEVPTLSDVFGWISPLYPKAYKLQDKKIEFNAEGTIL